MASDGESSYAIFLYPADGIEWIRGEGKSGNMGDARAQAGIISGEGINYIFKESGTDHVSTCTGYRVTIQVDSNPPLT